MPDCNDKKALFHIFVWVLALLSSSVAFFIPSVIVIGFGHVTLYVHHFLCAIVFANMAISSCLVITFLLNEEFPDKMLLVFNISATITYVIAGSLYLTYSESRKAFLNSNNYDSTRQTTVNLAICNGVFCILLALLHFIEFLVAFVKRFMKPK